MLGSSKEKEGGEGGGGREGGREGGRDGDGEGERFGLRCSRACLVSCRARGFTVCNIEKVRGLFLLCRDIWAGGHAGNTHVRHADRHARRHGLQTSEKTITSVFYC